jgi:hypothetical protein
LFEEKDTKSGLKSGIYVIKMLLRMMCQEFLSSWVRNAFKMDHIPYPPDLSPCDFLPLEKKKRKKERKKGPEGRKIFRLS